MNRHLYNIKKTFTFKRMINFLKIYISFYLSLILKKPVVWGYPLIMMIEPTNICNLGCPLCYTVMKIKNERGYMDFELYKKIIDEVAPYSIGIQIIGQGESFLHKEILKMIAYATEKKMYTYIATNGNVSINESELVNSGLDTLAFSIDGATQETYCQYRVNGSLDKALTFLKNVNEAKKQTKSFIPKIIWDFLLFKHNEHEIESVKKMADICEADELRIKPIVIRTKDQINAFLPTDPKYRRYRDIDTELKMKKKIKNKCKSIWKTIAVNWNGEMTVCCKDKKDNEPKIKIGNVTEKTLYELWKSTDFMNFRKNILENKSQFEICNNCFARD